MVKLLIPLVFALVSCASGVKSNDRAQLHLRLGTSQLAQGNYPQALDELLKAQNLDGKDPVIQNNLGLTYFMMGKLETSEIHFRKAIGLSPEFSDARNNLSRILIERKRYKEAEGEALKVIDDLTYTQPAKAWINLGLSQYHQEKYDLAKQSFTKSISYERESCLAQNWYGRSLLELHDSERAAVALDKAIVYCEKSDFEDPLYYAGIAWYRAGDKLKAEARFKSLVSRYPEGKNKENAIEMLKMIGIR